MELPAALRRCVDDLLSGIAIEDLAKASGRLSERYRSEIRDGMRHLDERSAAMASLAARLPATYAAVRAAMGAIGEVYPDFEPRRLLDVGAGPGTAIWAAYDLWSGLTSAVAVEGSRTIQRIGEDMAKALPFGVTWRTAELGETLKNIVPPFDLITLAYVLDELAPSIRAPLIEQLWDLSGDMLLIVEPGTPAGWERILDARRILLSRGAFVVAPCPHQFDCPLQAPDWCHFSRRVARSKIHLRTKNVSVPWEDEKFIYLAVSRILPEARSSARVIAAPQVGGGKAQLKLCRNDGMALEHLVTKRDKGAFAIARRSDWGDGVAL